MQPLYRRALLLERRQFQHKDITNADDGNRGLLKAKVREMLFGTFSLTENSFQGNLI